MSPIRSASTSGDSAVARRTSEHQKLRALEAASRGAFRIVEVSPDLRHYELELHVNAPVGTSEQYAVEPVHRLTLDLPDAFPQSKPLMRFDHPIFVPNIYQHGVPFIVDHDWHPSRRLDQVICDLVEEIQGRGANFGSVANPAAGTAFLRPEFVEELRQRLGEPVHLLPPPPGASGQSLPAPSNGESGGIRRPGQSSPASSGGIRRPGHPSPAASSPGSPGGGIRSAKR